MQDYRLKPEESPLAWCPRCRKLLPVDPDVKVMKTVFRVGPSGIFPYGIFPVMLSKQHQKLQNTKV